MAHQVWGHRHFLFEKTMAKNAAKCSPKIPVFSFNFAFSTDDCYKKPTSLKCKEIWNNICCEMKIRHHKMFSDLIWWWSGARRVHKWSGESLHLSKVRRQDMGAFFCIASNGVPPSVSRRVSLHVNCKFCFLPV